MQLLHLSQQLHSISLHARTQVRGGSRLNWETQCGSDLFANPLCVTRCFVRSRHGQNLPRQVSSFFVSRWKTPLSCPTRFNHHHDWLSQSGSRLLLFAALPASTTATSSGSTHHSAASLGSRISTAALPQSKLKQCRWYLVQTAATSVETKTASREV